MICWAWVGMNWSWNRVPLIAQWLTSLRVRRHWHELESGKRMRKKWRGERSGGEGDAYEVCFERLTPPLLSACNATVWFWLFFGYLIKLGLATGFNLVPRLAQIGKTWTGLIKHGLINFSHSPRRDNDKKSFYSRFHGRVIRLFLF